MHHEYLTTMSNLTDFNAIASLLEYIIVSYEFNLG
jgi:hypothetical protein